MTHDPDVAARTDHCLLLRAGRLVAAGEPGEVLPGLLPDPAAWVSPR
ncbi:hypothetical protein [Pseudonocardia adelaidensis]